MKIGLYGGTFNPFHNGHIGIIQHVKEHYGLTQVFIIPSASPPHKPDINLAPACDRFDMVQQSIKSLDGCLASDKELKRKGPSFTIDTIHSYKKEFSPDTLFYLLIGSDAFLDITTWKKKDQIFDVIQVIVMLRGAWENILKIASFIDENISKGYTFDIQENRFSHMTKQNIFICRVPRIDISSTLIRDRVKKRESIKDLVPASVEKIIYQKELYQ